MSSTSTDTSKASTGGESPRNVNPFLKAIMIIFAVPAMIVWESARSLCRKAYGQYDSGLPAAIGILIGMGGGIASGYWVGWLNDASIWKWLPAGIGGAVVTFVYLWPLLYLGVMKQLFRLSEELWDKVDGSKRSGSWLTPVLMFFGYVSVIAGSIYTGWSVLIHVHAWLEWGWFGYVGGAFAGFIAGMIVAGITWNIVSFGRMPVIAIASGLGLTYLFADQTQALVTAYGLTTLPVVGKGVVWGAYALEFFLYLAYIFPLAHIVLSRLNWLIEKIEELADKVYDEPKGGYREFFLQVVNIAAAWRFSTLSLLVWSFIGITNPYTVFALVGLTALLSYILVGQILNHLGSRVVGLTAAAHAVWFTFWPMLGGAALVSIGGLVAAVVAALAGALTYYAAFPVAYAVVRLVANPVLASWLRKPLVAVHDKVSEVVGDLVEELFHAARNTYNDTTPFRDVFLHLVGLGATAFAVVGVLAASNALAFATWLTAGAVALAAVLSYLLVGKLLVWAGNGLVGTLAGLAGGVFAGVHAYAAQPYGLWVAIPVGLIAAAAVWGLAFPVTYIVLRGLARIVRHEKWAHPLLTGAHKWCWDKFANVWAEFVEIYRGVRDWFRPTWDNLKKTWDDTWQSVKDTWDSVTGSRK